MVHPENAVLDRVDLGIERRAESHQALEKQRTRKAVATGRRIKEISINDSVAQLVEQQTLNLWVLSSILSGVTALIWKISPVH